MKFCQHAEAKEPPERKKKKRGPVGGRIFGVIFYSISVPIAALAAKTAASMTVHNRLILFSVTKRFI